MIRTRLVAPLALTFMVSCASFPVSELPQRIPDVVERFDGDLPRAIDLALDYLELAVTKEEQAAAAYRLVSPLVPPTIDAQIERGFDTVSDLIVKAVEALEKGVSTWAQVRAQIQPIVTAMNGLNDWIRQVQPQPQSQWKSLAAELSTLVAKAAIAKVLK